MKSKFKIKSKCITLILLVVAATVILTSNVFAYPPVQTGQIGVTPVSGSVSIDKFGASAVTQISLPYGSPSEVSVYLTYWYTNTITGVNTTISRSNGGNTNTSTSASRPAPNPDIYRSWRAQGTHTVKYSGQTWSANTEIYYNE